MRFTYLIRLSLTACLLLVFSAAFAQQFKFDERRFSAKKTIGQVFSHGFPDNITVQTDMWFTMQFMPGWNNAYKVKSVHDFGKFYVNNDTTYEASNYRYAAIVTIKGYKNPATYPQVDDAVYNDSLIITYNRDSLTAYQDKFFRKFSGCYKVVMTIWDIIDESSNDPATYISMASPPPGYHPQYNAELEVDVWQQTYDKRPYNEVYPNISTNVNSSYDALRDVLKVTFWDTTASPRPTPAMYELEWTYVDDYAFDFVSGVGTKSTSDLSYDFKNNATRIITDQKSYEIPVTYEKGYLVFRSRIVRPDSIYFSYPIYNGWSIVPQSGLISSLSSGHNYYHIGSSHMNDSLNWQYTVSFAEGGKYKQVMSYFDGSLKNRQTITRFNSNPNNVIATENIYDFKGRPAISILPTPVMDTGFRYVQKLSINSATGKPYAAIDFDTLQPPSLCPAEYSISPLDTSAWAYKYYSPLNHDTSDFQRFVPDAKGYPMIYTLISPENDKKILKQTGAGDKLQLADGNFAKYDYVTPEQTELNRFFGTEVGWTEYYKKTVSRDPNKQTSFSFTDNEGRTIASGMIGLGPDSSIHPIDPIVTPTASKQRDNLLQGITQIPVDHTWSMTKTSYAEADPDADYTVEYAVTVPPYLVCPGNGGIFLTIGAQYDYQLYDMCGVKKISDADTLGVTGVSHGYPGPNTLVATPRTTNLPQGPYTIVKNMSYVLDSAIVAVDKFMDDTATCLYNQDYFIRKSVQQRNFPCPLDTTAPCDSKRKKMMKELWPGAKYGAFYSIPVNYANPNLYINQTNSPLPQIGTSIFNVLTFPYPPPGVIPPDPPQESYYAYRYQWCPDVHFPDTVRYHGNIYTDIKHLPVDTFIKIFNDSMAWAMLPLHPEYCRACDNFVENYDEVLQSIPDYKAAKEMGYFSLTDIIDQDPLYTMLQANLTPTQAFDTLAYPRFSDRRMDSISIAVAFCGGIDSAQARICYEQVFFDQVANGNYDITTAPDVIQDQYYKKIIPMYLANRTLRKKILEDQSVTTHCAPCDTTRMLLKPDGIFGPVVFDPANPDSANLANLFLDADSTLPPWIFNVLAGVVDSNALDSATQLYANYQVSFCDSQVAQIARQLINCSTDTNVINHIHDSLYNYYCVGAGFNKPYSPNVIHDVIVHYSGALGDLCNPYLVNMNPMPTGSVGSFECKDWRFYDDARQFFAHPAIMHAIDFNTPTKVSLSLLNSFEGNIVTALGLSSPYTINIEYNNFGNNLYRLKLADSANVNDTMSFWFKKTDPTGICATALESLTGWSVHDVKCLTDGVTNVTPSLINAYSFFWNVDAVQGANSVVCQMLVWNDRIALMDTATIPAHDCIACTEIKDVYERFNDTLAAYGITCVNHPSYNTMLWNFVNYSMNKQYSGADIRKFVASCALADSIAFKNMYGQFRITGINAAGIEQIINHLNDSYYTGVGFFKYSVAGSYTLLLDLNNIPYADLLKAKKYIANDSAGLGYHYRYASSLNADSMAVVFMPTFIPGGLWLPQMHTLMGTDLADIDSAGISVYYSHIAAAPAASYKMYVLKTTTGLPMYKNVSYTDSLNHLVWDFGASVFSRFEPYVNKDYHRQEKKDFLTYNYSLKDSIHYMLLRRLSADSLVANIGNYAGKNVSYENPYITNNGGDLFISTDQPSDPGRVIAGNIITAVTTQHLAAGVFTQPYTNALFFAQQNKRIIPPTPAVAPNDSLNVYRCGDNETYWYRYFRNNKLYNMYVKIPASLQHPTDWRYVSSSLEAAEGDGNIYRFHITVENVNNTNLKAKLYGYTDFSLGYGLDMRNSMLCLGMYDDMKVVDTTTCERYLLQEAIMEGKQNYLIYRDSTRTTIITKYIAFLDANIHESLYLTSRDQKYHFTLYYYDRAGNLTRTVPPMGVTRLDTAEALHVSINADRESGSINPITMAAQDKSSFYKYNSLNQVIQQITPDGGTVDYYFDAVGRVVFSQNDFQRDYGYVSYTLYDAQGRIIETGEAYAACPPACEGCQPKLLPNIGHSSNYSLKDLYNYILTLKRGQVVATRYDDEYKDLGTVQGMTKQQNLRKRVSTVKFIDELPQNNLGNDFNTYVHATYYSYDIAGNVKTLTHEMPDMPLAAHKFKRIDYDYDMLSGKVNLLSYNRGMNDQFYQRYFYDADNRLLRAETSNDAVYWDDDANYKYYQHGPMARTELGDRRVQALDYAYTIQGWIKSVNSDIRDTAYDMGGDGRFNSIFPADVFNYALDYFPQDYNPIASQQVMHIDDVTKGLYNGNIGRQTTGIYPYQTLNKSYHYDPINRITRADYFIADHNVNDTLLPTDAFRSSYSYDEDGNLLKLTRMGSVHPTVPLIMDSLEYTYGTANQLDKVIDYADNNYSLDIRKNDTATYPTMAYDKIGRLIEDRSSTHKTMTWSLYNKLGSITNEFDNDHVQMKFTYDGGGNRITKSNFTTYGDTASMQEKDFYVRDASGNILAIYNYSERYALREQPIIKVLIDIFRVTGATGILHTKRYHPAFVHEVVAQAAASPTLLPQLLQLPAFNNAVDNLPDLTQNPCILPEVPGPLNGNAFMVIGHALEEEAPLDLARFILGTPTPVELEWTHDTTVIDSFYINYSTGDTTFIDTTIIDSTYIVTAYDTSRVALAFNYWLNIWPQGFDSLCNVLGVVTGDTIITDSIRLVNYDSLLRYYVNNTLYAQGYAGIILGAKYDSLNFALRDTLLVAWFTDSVLQTNPGDKAEFTDGGGGMLDPFDPGIGGSGGDRGGFVDGGLRGDLDALTRWSKPLTWKGILIEALYRHLLDSTALADRDTFLHFMRSVDDPILTYAKGVGVERLLEAIYYQQPDSFLAAWEHEATDTAMARALAAIPGLNIPDILDIGGTGIYVEYGGHPILANVLTAQSFGLAEHHLYGTSRLGIKDYISTFGATWSWNDKTGPIDPSWSLVNQRAPWYSGEMNDFMLPDINQPQWAYRDNSKWVGNRILGLKRYELTSHLGDVQATVLDRTTKIFASGVLKRIHADVHNITDYYPFGMPMPDRVGIIDTIIFNQCLGCDVPIGHYMAMGPDSSLLPDNYGPQEAGNWLSWTPWPQDSVKMGNMYWQGTGQGLLVTCDSNVTTTAGGYFGAKTWVLTDSGESYTVGFSVDNGTAGTLGALAYDRKPSSGLAYTLLDAQAIPASGDYSLTFTAISDTTWVLIGSTAMDSATSYTVEQAYVANRSIQTIPNNIRIPGFYGKKNYRFGFNGKEKVSEIAGEGNHYIYGFREYDPRTALFWSVDPLTKKYPWYTPYQFAGNSPIKNIDLEGLEECSADALQMRIQKGYLNGTISEQQVLNSYKAQAAGAMLGGAITLDAFVLKGKATQFVLGAMFAGDFYDNPSSSMSVNHQRDQQLKNDLAWGMVGLGLGKALNTMAKAAGVAADLPKIKVGLRSSEEVNAGFVARGSYAPYRSNTSIAELVTPKEVNLVRLSGPDNIKGDWFTTADQVKGLSPAQLKNKFSLKYEPTHVTDVTVTNGATLQIGEAAPIDQFGTSGGGYQVNVVNGNVNYGQTTQLK